MAKLQANKILVNTDEAIDILSIGRSKLLELTYAGAIPSLKVGRKRLFNLESLREWARDRATDSKSRNQFDEFIAHVEDAVWDGERDESNG